MHPLTPHDESGASRSSTRLRRATAVGLTAGLLGGGAAGLLFAVPSLTSASGIGAVVQDSTTDDTTTILDTADDEVAADDTSRAERGSMLRERLQSLVDDGTITAEQADAVAAHLTAQLADGLPGRGGHGERRGMGRGFDGSAVADALGITTDELRTALSEGQSVADVAAAEGVDVQVVIDAVVAGATTHLDQRVADGTLTQVEADARLAQLTEQITERVNTAGGSGRGGRHGGGMGRIDPSPDATDATDVTSDDDA